MQTARRRADVVSHRAVGAVTKTRALGAQIVITRAAVKALAADCRGGLRDNAVSLSKPLYATPDLGNCSAKLMAKDDGDANRPALRIMVLMDIAPADANATNAK